MTLYSFQQCPPITVGDDKAVDIVRLWTEEQLRKISLSQREASDFKLEILNGAPDRPRDGMVSYADGSNWNPGAGVGPYAYVKGLWLPMTPGRTVAPGGRLTLQSGVPLMTSSQSAKTTLFYTPFLGSNTPLGALSEISVATSDTSKNPSAIGASKVNDWFVWNDAGTPRLTHSVDWTNDTTRASGITKIGGIGWNTSAISNGPAALAGFWVGTTRSNGSSQFDFTFGSIAVGGGAASFGVWNSYNRRVFGTWVGDSTDSWTLAASAVRAANNSSTIRCSFIQGDQEDEIYADYSDSGVAGAGGYIAGGVGFDTTSGFSGITGFGNNPTNAFPIMGKYTTTALGFHFMSGNEAAQNAGTATFYGDAGAAATVQNGLYCRVWL